jgi:hypothetical protein
MRGSAARRWGALLLVVLPASALFAIGAANALASPATYSRRLIFTVASTTGNGGSCTGTVCPNLAAAVSAADENQGSTIQLGAGVYQISAGAPLDISTDMTIDGLGPSQTTIEQTSAGFCVISIIPETTVSIVGVTISGGTATGAPQSSGTLEAGSADGGGIDNGGTVMLTNDAISDNTATGGNVSAPGTGLGGPALGGAIDNRGAMTLDDDSLTGNTATGGSSAGPDGGNGNGGAIANFGVMTITASTLSGNTAAGGIGSSDGQGIGGGLENEGTLTIESSTIGPLNVAVNAGSGGGVAQASSEPLSLTNSTIFANAATFGGGLGINDGAVTLASDTIVANTAEDSGGNIAVDYDATLNIADTVIAGGVAGIFAIYDNCALSGATMGRVSDGGHNLESDSSTICGLAGASAGDLLVASAPFPSGLSSNGGPTQTLALLPGAPEIGAGGACTAAAGVDQRGLPRPATCDIGAFQTQLPANTAAPAISGDGQLGQALSCSQGSWTGDGVLSAAGTVGALSYSYQWTRGSTAIPGATASSYTTAIGDSGSAISCTVTATGAYGQASATTAAVTVPGILPFGGITIKAPKVTVTLTCAGSPAQTCAGKLSLTTVEHYTGLKLTAVSARAKGNKPKRTTRTVTLASASYEVLGGHSASFTLTLDESGKQLLARLHKLAAKLAITPSGTKIATVSKTISISRPAPKRRSRLGAGRRQGATGANVAPASVVRRSWSAGPPG